METCQAAARVQIKSPSYENTQPACSNSSLPPLASTSPAHLWLIEPHVVAHDVELHDPGPLVTFDPVGVEGQRVSQLVAQREGEAQLVLLSEAVQHVEHRAAGRLVGLEEHDVGVGLAVAHRRPLGVRRREDGLRSRLDAAEEGGGARSQS